MIKEDIVKYKKYILNIIVVLHLNSFFVLYINYSGIKYIRNFYCVNSKIKILYRMRFIEK